MFCYTRRAYFSSALHDNNINNNDIYLSSDTKRYNFRFRYAEIPYFGRSVINSPGIRFRFYDRRLSLRYYSSAVVFTDRGGGARGPSINSSLFF